MDKDTYLPNKQTKMHECADCLYMYLGTSQRHLADDCMSIPQFHCEDTPTHSPHCQYSSDHWCRWAMHSQYSFLVHQWILHSNTLNNKYLCIHAWSIKCSLLSHVKSTGTVHTREPISLFVYSASENISPGSCMQAAPAVYLMKETYLYEIYL